MDIRSPDDLLERLVSALDTNDRPVVFLVGSAFSLPTQPGSPGVPSAAGMIELIREEFSRDTSLKPLIPLDSYQQAFSALGDRTSQDVVNRVVQTAVLRARRTSPATPEVPLPIGDNERYLESLERDYNGWVLRPGTEALTRICSLYPSRFGRLLLTTNFDPLLEVGFRKLRSPFTSSALHSDGTFAHIHSAGCHVVHLHGYWRGTDTLHTPAQLQQDRPVLASGLRDLLASSLLVVLGYGGWRDGFMQALQRTLADPHVKPDVIWTFFDKDAEAIRIRHEHVLTVLRPASDRGRARLYGGVDAHVFMPTLARALYTKQSTEGFDPVLTRLDALIKEVSKEASQSPGETLKRFGTDMGRRWAVALAVAAAEHVDDRAPVGALSEAVSAAWTASRPRFAADVLPAGQIDRFDTLRWGAQAAVREAQGSEYGAVNLCVAYAIHAIHAYLLGMEVDGFSDVAWSAKTIHMAWRLFDSDDSELWSRLAPRARTVY